MTNPFFEWAILSLKNALELYQDKDQESKERHRFGALILMDLSVEYILKAKLYELKPKFIENTRNLGFSDVINQNEIRILFLDDEENDLWTVHQVRNLAQHRGVFAYQRYWFVDCESACVGSVSDEDCVAGGSVAEGVFYGWIIVWDSDCFGSRLPSTKLYSSYS